MKTIPAAEGVLADRTLVGTDLAEAYTAEIDAWLRAVIAEVGEVPGFALAAVGGYGRGDLSPGSDLDLLLIHQFEGSAAEVAERIWYPIWDSGMKLGHAVRTIDEALDLAGEDLDTATSLLEMRCLGGSEKLVDELAKKALGQWRENRDRMLDTMSARIRERHLEAGELAFLLEPDLKLSQGGLRDLHCLQWIDLADPSLLEDSERDALDGPHSVLLSARIELHRATGRANNQLLLQEQDEVADALGYGDADLLMAAVAEAARTVTGIEDAVLHRIHKRGRRRRWLARTRDLGHGILLAEETLTLADDAPVSDPIMPLRVAVHAAREDAFIVRDVLDRIATEGTALPNPWPDEARELFVDLLLMGHDMIRVVEALDQVDLVTRLIPEWAPNRHRPQRNAYTGSPSIVTCWRRRPKPLGSSIGSSVPTCSSWVACSTTSARATPATTVRSVWVSCIRSPSGWATHRRYRDPRGACPASPVAPRCGIAARSGRRRTVKLVADAVPSTGTIELLAALTEADSIATSKSAWNSWKAGLVNELAQRTVRYLQGHTDLESDEFPTPELLELAAVRETCVSIVGQIVTVVAPDRPGVFSRVAGALALHGIEIVDANLGTADGMATIRFASRAARHSRAT